MLVELVVVGCESCGVVYFSGGVGCFFLGVVVVLFIVWDVFFGFMVVWLECLEEDVFLCVVDDLYVVVLLIVLVVVLLVVCYVKESVWVDFENQVEVMCKGLIDFMVIVSLVGFYLCFWEVLWLCEDLVLVDICILL